MKLARTLSVAALAVSAIAIPSAESIANAATSNTPTPTAVAAAHGITKANGAPMGWMNKGTKTASPSNLSAQSMTKILSGSKSSSAIMPWSLGYDFSNYSGSNVNWSGLVLNSAKFGIIKTTEGTYYKNPLYAKQVAGARAAGMQDVGAYHFANPRDSSGAAQADFAIANGGGWKPNTHTIPISLDIEYDPYSSNECYGLTKTQMQNWILDFDNEYYKKEGIMPADDYSTLDWWNTCVGSNAKIAANSKIWIAKYDTSKNPAVPSDWPASFFWQTSDGDGHGYDFDRFNGSPETLDSYANLGH